MLLTDHNLIIDDICENGMWRNQSTSHVTGSYMYKFQLDIKFKNLEMGENQFLPTTSS